MTPGILGIGCVTAAGSNPSELLDRIERGDPPETTLLEFPPLPRRHRVALAPCELPPDLQRHPRLRRASRISLLTADAAFRALKDAGLDPAAADCREGLALVFAVSTGSVIYSRKFFSQLVSGTPGSPSPLLFPETVFNAPASHVASILGIDGLCETLVGDAAVGLTALRRASELIETEQATRVLVVAGEEVDWAVCEGYHRWRIRPVLAEAAAAVLLAGGAGDQLAIRGLEEGSVPCLADMAEALSSAIGLVTRGDPKVDLVFASGSGAYCDRIEAEALRRAAIEAPVRFLKEATGEPIGAGALLQILAAAEAVRSRKASRVLVTSAGYRCQTGAALIG